MHERLSRDVIGVGECEQRHGIAWHLLLIGSPASSVRPSDHCSGSTQPFAAIVELLVIAVITNCSSAENWQTHNGFRTPDREPRCADQRRAIPPAEAQCLLFAVCERHWSLLHSWEEQRSAHRIAARELDLKAGLMSLVVNYVKGLRGLKVKDLAPFTRKYAQEHLQPATLRYSAGDALSIAFPLKPPCPPPPCLAPDNLYVTVAP